MIECSLQSLPKHLVQKIACHATQWTRTDASSESVSIGNPVWKMQKYLALCRSWRASCLPLGCQDACLSVSRNMEIEDRRYWTPSIRSIEECGGQQYSRHAHLQLPFYAIVSGRLQELLHDCHTVLPAVTSVWLKIYRGDSTVPVPDPCDGYIVGFKRAIARMFPNATAFGIASSVVFGDGEARMEAAAGRLFAEFLRGGQRIQYFTAGNTPIMDPGFAAQSGLTSITYAECANVHVFEELIRNSRRTLQTLAIEAVDPLLLVRLACFPGGSAVEYPELTRLSACCIDQAKLVSRVPLLGAPFPALRHLTLSQAYPFVGDALFRGSYGSMERLSLRLDASDVAVLHGHGVLRPRRFPRVAHLELTLCDQPQCSDEALGMAAAVSEMAPAVANLQLHLPAKDALLRRLDAAPPAALRYLRLASQPLSVAEVLAVLRRVPTLAQLEIDPDGPDEPAERVADMVARFYPLAPRLRHVIFGVGGTASMGAAAHYALLLAVLCPSIACVRWASGPYEFADCCTELAATAAFKPHAARLRLVDWEKKR
ncbi:hypothetical protein H4R18_005383 [Coemansia javaensis]|uniref:Uncharacterized protein n=1 Tax=Coemansia javaensis TaxID=2761396 RepID=A0A9W8H9B9_9FUNG|nr:hypothetical protein H4R18_005383 [Coemansia javaensis]